MTLTSFVDRLVDGARRVDYRDMSMRIESFTRNSIELCRKVYTGTEINHCPKCGSADVRSSRPRQLLEAVRRQVTATAPFRCGRCGWRGWASSSFAVGAGLSAQRDQAVEPTPLPWCVAAASPRCDELDFDLLNIPRR